MADCERALGRPERALALAKSPAVANFDAPTKAEMTIVEAGARRDLGEYDAALRTLENAPLNNKTRATWVVRLRYTYADTLLAAGRPPTPSNGSTAPTPSTPTNSPTPPPAPPPSKTPSTTRPTTTQPTRLKRHGSCEPRRPGFRPQTGRVVRCPQGRWWRRRRRRD